MRTVWKGAIAFGLVTIPVRLYAATEEKDVSFHQVHRDDGGRIRYKRTCSLDGSEVAYSDIAKGFELPTGEVVVLDDTDMAGLPLSTSKRIEVQRFVPLPQVDPILFNKSYYCEPDDIGLKPYVVLREALAHSDRVALVKVALRQREALGCLRPRGDLLVLNTMVWPDEVRAPQFDNLSGPVEVSDDERRMADLLLETLAGDFDPAAYTDSYREAVTELIEAKVAGREVIAPPDADDTGAVVDLMAALQASVEAARKAREEAQPDHLAG
jgi:DNA end-binding protein Ku